MKFKISRTSSVCLNLNLGKSINLYNLCFASICLLLCGQLSAMPQLTDNWETTKIRTTAILEFSSGQGAVSMKAVNVDPEKKHIFCAYQPLKGFKSGKGVNVIFEARSNAAVAHNISLSVNAGPGCVPPTDREVVNISPQWKEYSVGLTPPPKLNGGIFELIWEGRIKEGETLDIRNLRVEIRTPFYLKEPRTSVIRPGDPQKISGTIACLGSYDTNWTVRVAAANFPDKTLLSTTGQFIYPEASWQIDVSSLPDGKYVLWLDYLTPEGRKGDPAEEVFAKAPAAELCSCVKNGTFYYQGKPFVPIGIFHAAPWNFDAVNCLNEKIGKKALSYDEFMKDIADHGFNCIHGVLRSQKDLDEWSALAARYGLTTIIEAQGRDLLMPANVIGCYGTNQAHRPTQIAEARRVYTSLKLKPVEFAVFACAFNNRGLVEIEKSRKLLDVVLADLYEIKAPDIDLSSVSTRIDSMLEHIKPDILFGYTPQAFIYEGPEPTPAQVRAQIYIGMIKGARAFMYYSYTEDHGRGPSFNTHPGKNRYTPDGMSLEPKRNRWWIKESLIWDEIKKLNSEIVELTPLILSQSPALKLAGDNDKILSLLKEAEGIKYFIAVNMTAKNQTSNFTFPDAWKMKGLFGTKELSIQKGKNAIEFAPYEVKIFFIQN